MAKDVDITLCVEFCEKCGTYRYFIQYDNSQNPWICMGHSNYDRFRKGEIDCGHEGFRPRKKRVIGH